MGGAWLGVDRRAPGAGVGVPGRGAYALQVVVAGAPFDEPATQRVLARVRSTLLRDPAVAGVLMPRPGGTIAPDHRTAIITGLAGAPPRAMVEAAGRVGDALARLATGQVTVRLTGAAALWSDFNAANKSAMVRSEALSWPLTLALLVIAFGTVTAAGLPLMLAMTGVLGAGGLLFVFGQVADVSIWAMPLRASGGAAPAPGESAGYHAAPTTVGLGLQALVKSAILHGATRQRCPRSSARTSDLVPTGSSPGPETRRWCQAAVVRLYYH
jgi:hypothetical protein